MNARAMAHTVHCTEGHIVIDVCLRAVALQIQRRFPNREAKLLVACSNGTKYSLDALEALDEAGYHNIVGLKGGYQAWFRCAEILLC